MKKTLVLIIILVILLGAALVLVAGAGDKGAKKDNERAPSTNSPKGPTQAQVEVRKEGFLPATLTVKKGTAVVWTNKDSKLHQIASDPHPTNNKLPGFDSLEDLKKGESYSFVFDKEGSFGYHDYLNPSTKGIIIVVE